MEIKPASAELDWSISYTLAAAETIALSVWSVAPSGGIAIKPGSPTIAANVTSAILTGGVVGSVYEVTNTITTNQGRIDPRTLTFRVGPSQATS